MVQEDTTSSTNEKDTGYARDGRVEYMLVMDGFDHRTNFIKARESVTVIVRL